MAEMRVVVQLSEAEYNTLLEDVTNVFENETSADERARKLRMLLQYRGYMTSGYEEKWSIPGTTATKTARATKSTRATKAARGAKKAKRRKAK